MGRRGLRAVAALGVIFAALGTGARADPHPYNETYSDAFRNPDVTGSGTAQASASTAFTGRVAGSAAVTEELPIGAPVVSVSEPLVGASFARGEGGVYRVIPVLGPMDLEITADFVDISATSSLTRADGLPYLTGGSSSVDLGLAADFACVLSACIDVYRAALRVERVSCTPPGECTNPGSVELRLRIEIPGGYEGEVVATAWLAASSLIQGEGSGGAAGSATIASVDAAPVG